MSTIKIDQDVIDAYNWLCALDIHSEEEATNKEIILCILDDVGVADYRERQVSKDYWKIKEKLHDNSTD